MHSQVYNDGPWRAQYVEVDIDWPYQVGNDKPQGKWLLYLEEIPTVDSYGSGECTVDSKYVNPLNLKNRPQAANLMMEPMMMQKPLTRHLNRTHSVAMFREKSSSVSTDDEKSSPTDNAIHNRVKRDRSMIIRADKLVDKDGKKTNIVSMVSYLKC